MAVSILISIPAHECVAISAGDACRTWFVGSHDLSLDTQAECWRNFQMSGNLVNVDDSTLLKEEDHYFSDVATTGNPADADIIALLVNERERRTPPKGVRNSMLYSALLLSGQIDAAEREREVKNLPHPPFDTSRMRYHPPPDGSQAGYWSVDEDHSDLVKGYIDLHRGPHIVVYSMSLCGPCLSAATTLAKSDAWRPIFRRYAIWIETADENFDLTNFTAWNLRFPEFPTHVLLDRRNWPQRAIPAVPFFFFIKDGRVVSKMVGWTRQNEASLAGRLHAIGL